MVSDQSPTIHFLTRNLHNEIKYKGIEKINGDEHRGGRGYHGRKGSGKKVKEKYADILVIF